MAPIDPAVASALDSHLSSSKVDDIDEDTLLESLDNDPSFDNFREQRLQQLHAELKRAKQLQSQEHGTYTEIKDEKALMEITTNTKYCVVHFFKPDFGKCAVMDSKLETLAPKHFDTRFLKINVENAPFLVTKLKIQVLPCLLAFANGISVDRIIGFEGVGHNPDMVTAKDLETKLLKAGVLVRAKDLINTASSMGQRRPNNHQQDDDEDDDAWD